MDEKELIVKVEEYNKKLDVLRAEIGKGIIGQEEVIDSVLNCILCNGHVLLESVPGLAKTLLVRVLTRTIQAATFQRIQFTPDLLPTDITGITVYDEKKGFYTIKGPIFANIVLADEINRAPPKVQSAMLQAMQEREVTIGRETFKLPTPFFVLATQNPLEQRGVYPLALAQVDRFLFKVFVNYPEEHEEFVIIDSNVEMKTLDEFGVRTVISWPEVIELQNLVKEIHISEEVIAYIVNLIDATRNPKHYDLKYGRFINWGASPRAIIFLGLSSRANALMKGRTYVMPEDVREVAHPVLRHRIVLNYEGNARNISTDEILDEIIRKVPVL